jgi:hypothetical protein
MGGTALALLVVVTMGLLEDAAAHPHRSWDCLTAKQQVSYARQEWDSARLGLLQTSSEKDPQSAAAPNAAVAQAKPSLIALAFSEGTKKQHKVVANKWRRIVGNETASAANIETFADMIFAETPQSCLTYLCNWKSWYESTYRQHLTGEARLTYELCMKGAAHCKVGPSGTFSFFNVFLTR